MGSDETVLPGPEEYIRDLRQGLWDIFAALGYDTDGDPTPAAVRGDLVEIVLDAAREHRKDAEYDYDEIVAERDDLLAEVDRLRAGA